MSFDLWLPEAKRPIVIVACVRHATGHPLPNARLVPPRWPGTGTVAGKVLCLRDAMATIPRVARSRSHRCLTGRHTKSYLKNP